MSIINKGCLWLGLTWEEAINKTLESMKRSKDIIIKEVYKTKYPNMLLCTEQDFLCYAFMSEDNHKTYKTRIPKKYNNYIKEELIKLKILDNNLRL